jgi:ketosteroid isomerase-like protein
MSREENIQIVNGFLEAQKRRDISAAVEFLSDDVQWGSAIPKHQWINTRIGQSLAKLPMRGKDEVREFLSLVSEDVEFEGDRVTDLVADADRVVVFTSAKFRMVSTDESGQIASAIVFTLGNGRICNITAYDDTDLVRKT